MMANNSSEVVAWMTADGRVALDSTKQIMPTASQASFNIPLTRLDTSSKAEAGEAVPVAYRVLRKTTDGTWADDARHWCDGKPSAELLSDIAMRSEGWRIQYAYPAPVPAQPAPSEAAQEPVMEFRETGRGADYIEGVITFHDHAQPAPARDDVLAFLANQFADDPSAMWQAAEVAEVIRAYIGQTAAQVTDQAKDTVLIQPMDVVRDELGYWSHPGIPNFDEDVAAYKAWLAAQGLVTRYASLENEDESHPAYNSYWNLEDPDIRDWAPQAPDDGGWFTLSIHDTEDGPVWVWARREEAAIAASKEASK